MAGAGNIYPTPVSMLLLTNKTTECSEAPQQMYGPTISDSEYCSVTIPRSRQSSYHRLGSIMRDKPSYQSTTHQMPQQARPTLHMNTSRHPRLIQFPRTVEI